VSRQGEWGDYVSAVQQAMLLSDWEVRLSEEPSSENTHAEVSICDQRKVAILHLGQGFDEQDASSQKHTIVHELLHLCVHPVDSAFRDVLEDLSPSARKVAKRSFARQAEIMVDQLARVFAQAIDGPGPASGVLPDGGKRRKRPRSGAGEGPA
jgi:hypothetical protein